MQNTLYNRPEDYDNQYVDYKIDLPFWEWAAEQYAGDKPIAEFAPGTGRVTFALARKGYHMIGVDLSEDMLCVARKKLAQLGENLNVELHHGDMCEFKTGQSHNLVFVPFTSFAHIVGTNNQLKALRNFHAHLADEGHLIVDTFNPSILHIANGVERFTRPSFEKRVRLNDGNLLVRYQTTHYYPATQQYLWVFYIEIYDGKTNDMIRKYTEEALVQVTFPNEWRMLLKMAGFEIVSELGDFDRNPFNDNSPRMLFVAKKA